MLFLGFRIVFRVVRSAACRGMSVGFGVERSGLSFGSVFGLRVPALEWRVASFAVFRVQDLVSGCSECSVSVHELVFEDWGVSGLGMRA